MSAKNAELAKTVSNLKDKKKFQEQIVSLLEENTKLKGDVNALKYRLHAMEEEVNKAEKECQDETNSKMQLTIKYRALQQEHETLLTVIVKLSELFSIV